MGMNMVVYQIVNEFKRVDDVTAIILVGSCGSGRSDIYSNINIDIITTSDIPIEKRKKIIKKFSDNIEINSGSLGNLDEFVLRNSTTQVAIEYLDFQWVKDRLKETIDEFRASLGYTTCLWNKITGALIVYDKNSDFKKLQDKYNVCYPKKLMDNIIEKNYGILKNNYSSYYYQIQKAINRMDIININSNISAFLNSYFDIIFAINEMPHPGEKRLINIIKSECIKIPKNFSENINQLLKYDDLYNDSILKVLDDLYNNSILKVLDDIVDELDILLKKEKLIC